MRTGIWTALIAGLSIVGSLVFACATPFAAIGALAASRMDREPGLTLVVAAWLSNQIVGYGILGYPRTVESFAWGAAIGLAAVLAFLGARVATAFAGTRPFGLASAFLAAFAVYELALYLIGTVLFTSDAAFSIAVVARILEINLVSFVGLLGLHWLAVAASLRLLTAKPAAAAGRP
jgi:hypothetical protein